MAANLTYQNSMQPDRRRRARLSLRWTARLFTTDHRWVEASIHNISSEGFYFQAPGTFPAGTTLRCVVAGPANDRERPQNTFAMECKIRIIYSNLLGSDEVAGTGCRIQEYRFFSCSR